MYYMDITTHWHTRNSGTRDACYMPCQLLVPLHILFPEWNYSPLVAMLFSL